MGIFKFSLQMTKKNIESSQKKKLTVHLLAVAHLFQTFHFKLKPVPLPSVQVQQTMHCGQRQAKPVQILQTEEVLQSWHEERR